MATLSAVPRDLYGQPINLAARNGFASDVAMVWRALRRIARLLSPRRQAS